MTKNVNGKVIKEDFSTNGWVADQVCAYPGRKTLTLVTIMTLSFRADRSGQTVQTQIRLLLEEQSDQGLH